MVDKYNATELEMKKELLAYVLEMKSPLAVYATTSDWDEGKLDNLRKIAQKFMQSSAKSIFAQRMADKVKRFEQTAIGAIAPDITLKDTEGKELKLSSLRGKYVLIDF